MKNVIKAIIMIFIVIAIMKGYEQAVEHRAMKRYLSQSENQLEVVSVTKGEAPKYIFLFIGDGMSYPQIQLANYYQKELQNSNKESYLNMLDFDVVGTAMTYDENYLIPESSSAGTSIATGQKTSDECINMNVEGTKSYETIAEKLKKQKGYKVGIVTSVNLNHATPAAFYAHQVSRRNYYEIGMELIHSGFDYFAGGSLRLRTGENKDQENLYKLAQEKGYQVVLTDQEAKQLKPKNGKVIVIAEHLAEKGSFPYAIDAKKDEMSLSDYVEKGIELLDNEDGFFMMVEGGKIDWACHANDASTVIHETIKFDDSIQTALEFYKKHPSETLILVTGDHETGGLSIGYAGTLYDTNLLGLSCQKISFSKFDEDYVSSYKKNQTEFSSVCKDITELFGLCMSPTQEQKIVEVEEEDHHMKHKDTLNLTLTLDEYKELEKAYVDTMNRTEKEVRLTAKEYLAYGSYEPLTITIQHILAHKCGVDFSTYAHSALSVPVFAKGKDSSKFSGYYDNTKIFQILSELTGVK